MWKALSSGIYRGCAILGIGIFLVSAINNRVLAEPTARTEICGPPELFGPMPNPTPEPPVDTWVEPAVGTVTSVFGTRWGRSHQGIDIGGAEGSDIRAAKSGIVVYAGWADGYGNYLILDHGDKLKTAYGHCSILLAKEGDAVEQGQIVAKMGNTGNSTGPHLHFEIQKDNIFLNPQEYGLY